MSEANAEQAHAQTTSTNFVFLSYSREDKEKVDQAYQALREARLNPWMDVPPVDWVQSRIPVGADWDVYLQSRIRDARAVVVFLSQFCTRQGYFQRELQAALEVAKERPGFIVPVLLDETPLVAFGDESERLSALQTLTRDDSVARLVEAVRSTFPARREVVSAEDLALVSTSWYAPKHGCHRVDVAVSGRPEHLAQIAQVVYFLPPAWPTSPAATRDSGSSFLLKEKAWADLVVRARVYITGQPNIALATHVRLTHEGPRIDDMLKAVAPV